MVSINRVISVREYTDVGGLDFILDTALHETISINNVYKIQPQTLIKSKNNSVFYKESRKKLKMVEVNSMPVTFYFLQYICTKNLLGGLAVYKYISMNDSTNI